MADIDRSRVEAFLERFVAMASGATTIGLLSVADRSGLSAHLARVGEGSAAELAEGAGLELRYVEEILSGLAAAGVVEYDPDEGRFLLPPEHALFIADVGSPYFMGGYFDMIPAVMAKVGVVADATAHGGGVAFEEFGPGFIGAIERGNAPSQRTFLVSRWLPAVPGLVESLQRGIRVADVGCGSGTAACLIAAAFPESTVHGYDVSPESIEAARARSADLPNVEFVTSTALQLPTDPGFGLVTAFDVIHDLEAPLAALRRIREALTADGVFLMMEPNMSSRLEENLHPIGALTYGISALHCLTQSLARGGAGLGAGWGRERAEALATEAGFSTFHPLEPITNRFSAFYLLRP